MATLLRRSFSRSRPLTRSSIVWLGITIWTTATFRTIDEYLISINPCGGPSMLPTFAIEGEWLITVKWPAFRLLNGIKRGLSFEKEEEGGGVRGRLRKKVGYGRTAGRPLALGDLVFAVAPGSGKQVCKRVVGLPGDTILMDPRTIPLPRSAWLSPSSPPTSSSSSSSISSFFEAGTKIFNKDEPTPESDDSRSSSGNDQGPTMQPDGVIGSISSEATYVTVPKGHVFLCGDNLSNSVDSRDYGPVPLALVKGRVVAVIKPFATNWLFNNWWGKLE
ncbi:hypothetical protein CF319_g524 [Tilletia indica]|nr:hypothetical protein CF319_g524 [Tilletia indica]